MESYGGYKYRINYYEFSTAKFFFHSRLNCIELMKSLRILCNDNKSNNK